MRSIVRLCASAIAVVAIATVATSASVAAASRPEKANKAKVKVKEFDFRPSPIEVRAGTTVVWKNKDAVEHTVTSDSGAPTAFDGVMSGKGKSFKTRLNDPGTYAYHCERHPSMKGTVIVT